MIFYVAEPARGLYWYRTPVRHAQYPGGVAPCRRSAMKSNGEFRQNRFCGSDASPHLECLSSTLSDFWILRPIQRRAAGLIGRCAMARSFRRSTTRTSSSNFSIASLSAFLRSSPWCSPSGRGAALGVGWRCAYSPQSPLASLSSNPFWELLRWCL